MDAIHKLKKKLLDHPGLSISEKENSITIAPLSRAGFLITLIIDQNGLNISFGHWHDHFQLEDEAISFILFGLSNKCRLREIRRGKTPYKWIVEKEENGQWEPISTTGSFLFPFWQKRDEIIYQNQ